MSAKGKIPGRAIWLFIQASGSFPCPLARLFSKGQPNILKVWEKRDGEAAFQVGLLVFFFQFLYIKERVQVPDLLPGRQLQGLTPRGKGIWL